MKTRLMLGAIAVAAVVAGGSSASAYADSTCPDGYACLWKGGGYTGDKKTIPSSQGGLGWIPLTGDFDQDVESVKNKYSNRKILFATTHNGGGDKFCVHEGGTLPDLFLYPIDFNNRISSFRVTAPGGGCGF